MFVIKQESTPIEWPLEWNEPQSGGGFVPRPFKGVYRLPRQERLDEIRRLANQALRGELAAGRSVEEDIRLADEYFTGWADVNNPDGTVFEVNPVNRAVFMGLPGMREVIIKGLYDIVTGTAERKNSKTPRATG